MKKNILNIILPVISFSSMVVGIEDLCYYIAWRIFIMAVVIVLFVLALVLIKRKAKLSLIIISFIASFIISGALCYDYSSIKRTEKTKELWHDYLSENRNKKMTNIEIEAIEHNNPIAQYELACNYLNGNNGYTMDFESAKYFAQRSADQGNAKAHDLLAYMYLIGRGCQPDTLGAISNSIQAIKEGYLDISVPLLILLKNSNIRLKENDSLLIINSYYAGKYIDSLATVLSDTTGLYIDIYPALSPEDIIRCDQLSDDGYHKATEVIYSDALIKLDTINIYKYSSKLKDMGRIPDYPTMRFIFMYSIYGDSYYPSSLTGTEIDSFIERSIKNQDYLSLVSPSDFALYGRYADKFSYYKYALAQYNRVKYLRKNKELLYVPIISMVDDLDRLFDYSKSFLEESTKELTSEMKKRPYVFSSYSSR